MSATQPAMEAAITAAAAGPQSPANEDIQRRAYELWQTRLSHGGEGTAEQDWAMAERELSANNEQPDV